MMSKIYINFRRVGEINYILPYIENRAEFVRKQISRLKRQLPACVCETYQIRERFEQVCKEINKTECQIGQLYEVVNCCVEQYKTAEYKNEKNAEEFL